MYFLLSHNSAQRSQPFQDARSAQRELGTESERFGAVCLLKLTAIWD